MRNLTACIIALIFNTSIVFGQSNSTGADNWEKILITDSYNGWFRFNNEFQISRRDLLLTYLDKPDSILKQINPALIDTLLLSLHNKKGIKDDPLIMFDRDSMWLEENAGILWKKYLGKRKASQAIDSIAINTLKDYQKVKSGIWGFQGSRWTDDYPFILVQVINGQDTLSVSSTGQYPYMLPWNVNGKRIYNSKISEIISQLLPEGVKTNKPRLAGEGFNYYLIESVYHRYIEANVEYAKARNKYRKQFDYLGKEFQIKHAEISDMSSIEWGGFYGKPCLKLTLFDSTISNQIRFSTVFGTHGIFHSPKSIIRNKQKLINNLRGNPVYEYAKDCKNCLGEIHWVKSRSLSREAKRNFLRDVKDNGMRKSKFKGKFKDAIFFELTENRDSNRSFSRWIFLKDGIIVLWQLQGEYLMNLPKSITKNQGYVCRTMKSEEFMILKPIDD